MQSPAQQPPVSHPSSPVLRCAPRWLAHPLVVMMLAAAASALCGLLLQPRAFILLAAVGAVMLIGVAWPWLAVRGISIEVSFARQRGRVGQPVDAIIRVQNRWLWPAWGLVVTVPGTALTYHLPALRGWNDAELCWQLLPEHRGLFPASVPQAGCAFPFGLWQATRPVALHQRLLVWPQTVALAALENITGARQFDGGHQAARAGDDGDLLGVRPFRQGDRLRRVHWGQTARYDRLIVCERHGLFSPAAAVVLDTAAAVHLAAGSLDSLEEAIRIAASAIESLLAADARVTANLGGQRIIVDNATGLVPTHDTLALVHLNHTCLSEQLANTDAVARDQLQIVITTDLGLERLPAACRHRAGRKFIVLHTHDCFTCETHAHESHAHERAAKPQGAWAGRELWLPLGESPAMQLRRRWQEVARAG